MTPPRGEDMSRSHYVVVAKDAVVAADISEIIRAFDANASLHISPSPDHAAASLEKLPSALAVIADVIPETLRGHPLLKLVARLGAHFLLINGADRTFNDEILPDRQIFVPHPFSSESFSAALRKIGGASLP